MENHNDNQSPPLPRHGTAAELEILRDRVPQTFDRYDLFDSNLAALLLHNDLVPEDMRSMLRNRMERDRDANFRPIPDLSGRRLAYEPSPAAMFGLDPTAPNMGSASVRPRATTATRANVGPSNSPASSVPSSPAQSSARSPSASPRPRTTDSQTAFDSPQDLVSRSQTPKSLGQASSASASAPGPWSPGATLLLFRLRAQGVSFPDCVVSPLNTIYPTYSWRFSWSSCCYQTTMTQ